MQTVPPPPTGRRIATPLGGEFRLSLIVAVEPRGPAERAGLEEGDVVVAFEGRPVAGLDDLHRLLTEERVGLAANLDVLRRDSLVEVEVVPEESTG